MGMKVISKRMNKVRKAIRTATALKRTDPAWMSHRRDEWYAAQRAAVNVSMFVRGLAPLRNIQP